jgi:hypothetical protein
VPANFGGATPTISSVTFCKRSWRVSAAGSLSRRSRQKSYR